jgi:hypothetical protein
MSVGPQIRPFLAQAALFGVSLLAVGALAVYRVFARRAKPRV